MYWSQKGEMSFTYNPITIQFINVQAVVKLTNHVRTIYER